MAGGCPSSGAAQGVQQTVCIISSEMLALKSGVCSRLPSALAREATSPGLLFRVTVPCADWLWLECALLLGVSYPSVFAKIPLEVEAGVEVSQLLPALSPPQHSPSSPCWASMCRRPPPTPPPHPAHEYCLHFTSEL